ncbi:MAG: hypothetical protein N3B13_01660 [Deltaproteobacteria bacterium]|nr:hypothetical protein [Deltaproteobacteria bacterium]
MPDEIQKGTVDIRTDKGREDDRRIPLVEEIFHNIVKSIKTIAIYKHNRDRFSEFVEPAYKLLEKFLNQNESLVVRVEPYSFKFLNAEVYKDTDQYSNISYRFFRDGARRITFKKGLTLNEFLQFVLIVSGQSQVSKQAEDTISQLWLANLENIELTVIEGGVSFADADGNENENEKIEMDTIVNFLEQKLASSSDEAVGFARLSATDIGLELESVQQIKGLKKKPEIVSESTRQVIQEFFLSEDEFSRVNRVKRILFAILKSDINDLELQDILENFVLILDYLLLLDDIDKLAEFLNEIERESVNMTLPQGSRERLMQLRMRIQQELNTDLRLERIFQILRTKKIGNTETLSIVTGLFNESSFTKIPRFIEQIEIQENLNTVLEILRQPRVNYETIWINLLNSKKMNLVATALDVIKGVEFEGRMDAVLPLLNSHIPQIAFKALEIIASDNSEKAAKEILQYIDQNKTAGRDNIIKVLHLMPEETQANIILKMLLDENLKLEDSHRLILYTKMADLIELPQIESYFNSVFNEKGSLFSKGKSEEKKRLLIKALGSSPSLITYQYLLRQAKNDNCSDTIKKEITLTAEMIRKKLQGK